MVHQLIQFSTDSLLNLSEAVCAKLTLIWQRTDFAPFNWTFKSTNLPVPGVDTDQCLGWTTDTYLSRVTETVDQMDPLREVWTRGSSQGKRCGCNHTLAQVQEHSWRGTIKITLMVFPFRQHSSLAGIIPIFNLSFKFSVKTLKIVCTSEMFKKWTLLPSSILRVGEGWTRW